MSIKILFLFLILLLNSLMMDGQELEFINQRSGKITSFKPGDKIGFTLKGWVFPNRRMGKLISFTDNSMVVNNKTYELDRISQIRHVKVVPELILGGITIISGVIAAFLFIPLILPIPDKNFVPFAIFMAIYFSSLVTKEIITGNRVSLDRHEIKYNELHIQNNP